MLAYALIRIKPGAKCFQDFTFYTWPLSDYGEEGKAMADIADSAVFVGKKVRYGEGTRWYCKTHGAGMKGSYRNGEIIVWGDDPVEMLTPLLGYEPDLENTHD
jgi:hypothetical protein